jgi:glycosyltransferase involved in cell wall biosynthesis
LNKLVIVNTADAGGGVERRSMLLLDRLLARGVDAWMVVGAKHSEHPRVVWMHESPHVDYRPYQPRRRRWASRGRWRVDRRLGREDFEHPLTRRVLEMTGSPPDVILCQNLHGGYFDLRMLPWLSCKVPVILSLSDSWLFTGHCACPLTCGRWETGCGRCPDLAIPPAIRRDNTAANWQRKRRVLASSRVWAIAPSAWMLERARRSLLGDALMDVRVIRHGIDLDTFSPGSRLDARHSLGIDAARSVLLYVVNLGAANPTKDFATLRATMERLARMHPLRAAGGEMVKTELIVIGAEAPEERLSEHVAISHRPYCQSREQLAELYRACDMYVHSAPEEPFSLTTAEAMGCGTVVSVAAGGGIRELIDHNRTGMLLDSGDAVGLAATVRELQEDPERRAAMGEAAAIAAHARFDAGRMTEETINWCGEVARRWRATPQTENCAATTRGGTGR